MGVSITQARGWHGEAGIFVSTFMMFITRWRAPAGDMMDAMLDQMKRAPFFQNLDGRELDLLAPVMEPVSFAAGRVIFEQGSAASYLYIIERGTAEIRYKPYDGPAITLTHLGAGDVCGWSAVIGNRTYASTLISESDMEAVRMRGSALRQLCLDHPETGRIILDRLARAVASRWKDARTQVREMLNRKISS
jgi:CRP/FNR family cyclic AMP-dependent transcriptional regulator